MKSAFKLMLAVVLLTSFSSFASILEPEKNTSMEIVEVQSLDYEVCKDFVSLDMENLKTFFEESGPLDLEKASNLESLSREPVLISSSIDINGLIKEINEKQNSLIDKLRRDISDHKNKLIEQRVQKYIPEFSLKDPDKYRGMLYVVVDFDTNETSYFLKHNGEKIRILTCSRPEIKKSEDSTNPKFYFDERYY